MHPAGDFSEFFSLLTNMARVEANIYGINEHNSDAAQPEIKRAQINKGKRADKYGANFFIFQGNIPRGVHA